MTFLFFQYSKFSRRIPKIITGLLFAGGASYVSYKHIKSYNYPISKWPSVFFVTAAESLSEQINSLNFIADVVETTMPSVVSIRSGYMFRFNLSIILILFPI